MFNFIKHGVFAAAIALLLFNYFGLATFVASWLLSVESTLYPISLKLMSLMPWTTALPWYDSAMQFTTSAHTSLLATYGSMLGTPDTTVYSFSNAPVFWGAAFGNLSALFTWAMLSAFLLTIMAAFVFAIIALPLCKISASVAASSTIKDLNQYRRKIMNKEVFIVIEKDAQ